MNANGVEIHSAQLSRSGINRQILKNGSSVLVRIINNKGNGKFEGSVAGVRVNITSERQLKVGESFIATINAKNGTIYLEPKDAALASMTMNFSEIEEKGLLNFLSSIGVPADSFSVSVLQIIKQMGLKIDAGLITRIRNLALHFTGKEKSAAELLAVISEKGLEASEEEIRQLLILLESYEENKKNDSSSNESGKKLLNKINNESGAWYLLPFEIISTDDFSLVGKGNVRLLLEASRLLKQMNISTVYNNNKYLFSILYKGRKISNISFNVSGKKSIDDEITLLKKKFLNAGLAPGKIEWTEADKIEGNASGLESFYSFGGKV